jgi:hypothetical protein
MTPEQERQLAEVYEFIQKLNSNTSIPYEVGEAFKKRVIYPPQLVNAPRAAVTAPSGGATVDTQARTAINSIITRLEELGLVIEN